MSDNFTAFKPRTIESGHALTDHKANQLTALSDQLNWVLICLPDVVCSFKNGRTPV